MGKTVGRWLRDLFHGGRKKTKKKKEQQQSPILAADESVFSKEKRKWGFAKSKREEAGAGPVVERGCRGGDRSYEAEQNKRAMVVAAATAAVAEAAVAAAQAAAAVVRLTSSGRAVGFYGSKAELLAATKIQTAFRGYLARRALRALRALVKLQALVRGHIVRKQAAETLRCMQALVRVQARARACRSLSSELSLRRRTINPNLGRRLDPWGGDQDRILEVDTGKPRPNPKRRPELSSSSMASDQNSRSFATSVQFSVQSSSSVDMPLQQSLSPLRAAAIVAGEKLARGTSLAAALSDCSSSFFSTYSDHPSYMACTESSKAKARSQSAPKQRPEVEKSGSGHRGAGGAAGRTTAASSSSSASSMQVKFSSKAYPGSGRLDRLGMPIRY